MILLDARNSAKSLLYSTTANDIVHAPHKMFQYNRKYIEIVKICIKKREQKLNLMLA